MTWALKHLVDENGAIIVSVCQDEMLPSLRKSPNSQGGSTNKIMHLGSNFLLRRRLGD